MLYAIEIAQTYSSENGIKQELFYKSMLNSYEQATNYIVSNGIFNEYKSRIIAIHEATINQNWKNKHEFESIVSKIKI